MNEKTEKKSEVVKTASAGHALVVICEEERGPIHTCT